MLRRSAANLPRTVLSAANSAESPTVVVARREMEAWRILQLEPSALRQLDEFSSPVRMGKDERHLAATVYRLARSAGPGEGASLAEERASRTCSQIAIRLSELIDEVRDIRIDRDEKRELLTLTALDGEGTLHPARALSDGTLRFLALVVLEMDPETDGVLCLEEPENGIHPARIPAILKLLLDIAVDPFEPAGPGNPVRQVIINTHSPAVFQEVPDDSVVFVKTVEAVGACERLFRKPHFHCLSDTWTARNSGHVDIATRRELLPYLSPDLRNEPRVTTHRQRRVIDREDLPQFPFLDPAATP